ncbi:MAG: MFS transporter [Fimbriimonadaceae bacterium]|nr:MFS transporter [Fimbriimonadaceae bacterium]
MSASGGSWRSRNVVTLGLVSFFTDLHSETILALLPQFMTHVLGLRPAAIGLIEGLAECTASLLKIVSGWWSDRVRRRQPVVLLGYALSTAAKPLLSLATAGWQVLAVRLADRFGKGVRSAARDALVADSVDPAQLGRAFGFHRAMDTSGAVLGTLAAVLLLRWSGGDYRRVFLAATLAGVVAVALLAGLVRDPPPRAASGKRPRAPLAGNLRLFLVAHGVYSAGNFSYAFFLLRAEGCGVAAAVVPLLYLWHNVVYAAVSFPAGALLDRLGPRRAQVTAYLLQALTCLGFAATSQPALLWLWFAVYGLQMGAVGGCSRATVAGLLAANRRGLGMGVFHAVEGVGLLLASIVGGQLAEHVGGPAPFVYSALLATAAALLVTRALPPPARTRAAGDEEPSSAG